MTFLDCDAYNIQKLGCSEEEYEDSFCVGALSENEYRFAIADGATESSFSGLWAELLTEGFLKDNSVRDLARRWAEKVDALELPWYAREKAEEGAWAAFMGMTLYKESQTYELAYQGDCNLFHISESKLLRAIPIELSADFNNSPELIGSREIQRNKEFGNISGIVLERGKWTPGDIFFLMTDALAAWYVRGLEANSSGDVQERILSLENQSDFERLVQELRDCRDEDNVPELKNDDVTLIRILIN